MHMQSTFFLKSKLVCSSWQTTNHLTFVIYIERRIFQNKSVSRAGFNSCLICPSLWHIKLILHSFKTLVKPLSTLDNGLDLYIGQKQTNKWYSRVSCLAGRAGSGANDGDSSHNDRRSFLDETFIIFVLWSWEIKVNWGGKLTEVSKQLKKRRKLQFNEFKLL